MKLPKADDIVETFHLDAKNRENKTEDRKEHLAFFYSVVVSTLDNRITGSAMIGGNSFTVFNGDDGDPRWHFIMARALVILEYCEYTQNAKNNLPKDNMPKDKTVKSKRGKQWSNKTSWEPATLSFNKRLSQMKSIMQDKDKKANVICWELVCGVRQEEGDTAAQLRNRKQRGTVTKTAARKKAKLDVVDFSEMLSALDDDGDLLPALPPLCPGGETQPEHHRASMPDAQYGDDHGGDGGDGDDNSGNGGGTFEA